MHPQMSGNQPQTALHQQNHATPSPYSDSAPSAHKAALPSLNERINKIAEYFQREAASFPQNLTDEQGKKWAEMFSHDCQEIAKFEQRVLEEEGVIVSISKSLENINRCLASLPQAEQILENCRVLRERSLKVGEQIKGVIEGKQNFKDYKDSLNQLKIAFDSLSQERINFIQITHVLRELGHFLRMTQNLCKNEALIPLLQAQLENDFELFKKSELIINHCQEFIKVGKENFHQRCKQFLLNPSLDNFSLIQEAAVSNHNLRDELDRQKGTIVTFYPLAQELHRKISPSEKNVEVPAASKIADPIYHLFDALEQIGKKFHQDIPMRLALSKCQRHFFSVLCEGKQEDMLITYLKAIIEKHSVVRAAAIPDFHRDLELVMSLAEGSCIALHAPHALPPQMIQELDVLKLKAYILFKKQLRNTSTAFQPGALDLFKALDEHRIDLLTLLIKDIGLNPNTKDREGHSLLELAVIRGQVDAVKLLLQLGANPETLWENQSVLWWALESHHVEMIETLQQGHANINHPSQGGQTALSLATLSRDRARQEYLLKWGAKIDAPNRNGDTAVHVAMQSDNENALLYFISQDPAVINSRNSITGKTALHQAAAQGNIKMVRFLIEQCKATTECTDAQGHTPLFTAVLAGNKQIVRLLLELGANPNSMNGKKGITLLQWVLSAGDSAFVQELLAADAHPNAPNLGGMTAVHYAALHNRLQDLPLLLRMGGDIHDEDLSGSTPLSLACASGHQGMIVDLLECGADPKIGNKPLLQYKGPKDPIAAIKNNQSGWLKILIQRFRIDPNFRDKNGFSLLEIAIQSGNRKGAEVLINQGARITEKGPGGRTPLHLAVEINSVPMINLLLGGTDERHCTMVEKNQMLNSRNDQDQTPRMIAFKNNFDNSIIEIYNRGGRFSEDDLQAYTGNKNVLDAVISGRNGWLKILLDVFEIDPAQNLDPSKPHPLQVAVERCNVDAAMQLLQHLPAFKLDLSWNEESIFWWVLRTGDQEMIKTFQQHCRQFDINMHNSKGLTALVVAIWHDDMGGMRALKACGANMEAQTIKHATPLYSAISWKKPAALIQVLVGELGADANGLSGEGEDKISPLYAATQENNAAIIRTLIPLRADVRISDKNGWTPLHVAAFKNFPDCIAALAESPISTIDVRNKKKQTAYYLACVNEKKEAVAALLKAGANKRISDGEDRADFYLAMRNPKLLHSQKNGNSDLLKDAAIKFLGHAFEVAGKAAGELSLDGAYEMFCSQKLLEGLKAFNKDFPEIVPKDVLQELHGFFLRGLEPVEDQKAETLYNEYCNGQPIQIYTGFNEHSVVVQLWLNRLVICNRGAYGRKPIEVLRIDPQTVTPENIKEIIKLRVSPESAYKAWLDHFEAKFSVKHDAWGEMIEKAFPIEFWQRSGNCGYSSPLASIFTLWAMFHLKAIYYQAGSGIKPVQVGFVKLKQFLQLLSLAKTAQALKPGDNPFMTPFILMQILRETLEIPFCPPSLLGTIQQFQRDFMGTLTDDRQALVRADQVHARLKQGKMPVLAVFAGPSVAAAVADAKDPLDPQWIKDLLNDMQLNESSKCSDEELFYWKVLNGADRPLLQAFKTIDPNSIHLKSSKGETLLSKTVASNDFARVKMLVDLGTDVTAKNAQGKTAQEISWTTVNAEMMTFLWEAGGRQRDCFGPPATRAALVGNELEKLITGRLHAPQPNESEDAYTLRLEEALNGLLIKYDLNRADIDVIRANEKNNLMHRACFQGHIHLVRLLSRLGAQSNVPAAHGSIALHMAAASGSVDVISFLLSRNEVPNTQNKNKETPLHCAVKKGSLEAVRLLALKTNLRLVDKKGWTPLKLVREKIKEKSSPDLLAIEALLKQIEQDGAEQKE